MAQLGIRWGMDDGDPHGSTVPETGSGGAPAPGGSSPVRQIGSSESPADPDYDPFEDSDGRETPSPRPSPTAEYDPFRDAEDPSDRPAPPYDPFEGHSRGTDAAAAGPSAYVAFQSGTTGSGPASAGARQEGVSEGTTEVFAFRKQGRLAEALLLARRLYSELPSDPWRVRALFWTLHTLHKMSDGAEKREYRREMLSLPELPEDNLYTEERRRLMDEARQIVASARSLQQHGKLDEAKALLTEALAESPDHPELERGLGWLVYQDLKRRIQQDSLSKQEAVDGLRTVVDLSHYDDQMLDRCVLQLVLNLHKDGRLPHVCSFLRRWNLEKRLRPEDYQPSSYNGKRIPPLAERALGAVRKGLETTDDPALVEWAVGLAERMVGRIQGGEWAPYHYAKILSKVGQGAQGRQRLLPFLRRKANEAWAWHALAETFPAGSAERLASLARGALCPAKEEGLKAGVLGDLALALQACGHVGEAKAVLQRLIEVRLQNHWPVGQLQQRLDTEPLASAQAVDPTPLIRELAAGAEDLLWEGAPRVRGWLASKPYRNKEENEVRAIQLEGPGGAKCSGTRSLLGALWDEPVGKPVEVVLKPEASHAIALKVRPAQGSLWEGYPAERAVLMDQNRAKRLAVFRLASGRVATRTYSDSPEVADEPLGGFWVLRTAAGREENAPLRVLDLERSDDASETSEWRSFRGELRCGPEQYGTVGDVHVPESVMTESGACQWCGRRVRVLAIRNTKVGGHKPWRAVRVWLEEEPGVSDPGPGRF